MDCAGMTCALASGMTAKRSRAKVEVRTMKGGNVERPTPNVQSAVGRIRRGECRTSEAVRHLYVHIPFCARICPYCAFYKERADSSQTQRFCEALLREIETIVEGPALKPRTIFFGGGTPTALTTTQLQFLLGGMRERLDLAELAEFTLEANPGSVSPRKATLLRSLGVSRLSLGVQSWDDDLLKLLGREHDAAQAETSFRILREAGF